MATLEIFPIVNQIDGSPNEQFNCVPASIAAALEYLTGKKYSPAQMLLDTYGDHWINEGTSADAFVKYCAAQGVKLTPVETSSPAQAIAAAHTAIQQGLPVVFTQQDDYAPPQYRDSWTHVCVWYGEAPGSLTAMDPYGGKSITSNDATWAARLRSNEIWLLELEREALMLDLIDPYAARYFEQTAGGAWKCKKTGKILGNAMLAAYRQYGTHPQQGIFYLGLPVSDEIGLGNGCTKQHFELGVLGYDPTGALGGRPGQARGVYPLHLYDGPGQDPRVAQLQTQLVQAQKQAPAAPSVAQLQQQLAAVQQQLANT